MTAKKIHKKPAQNTDGTEVSLFLHPGIVAREAPPDVYSIEREYVKTKRNRHLRVFVILLVFFTVLFAGTFSMTSYIESQTSRIAISISDFEDLNLAELLALARDAEKNMNKMSRDMESIKARMSSEIEGAVAGAKREIEKIRLNNSLSESRKTEMIRKIRSEQELKVSSVKNMYANKISERENKINELEKNLEEYRAQSKQSAEKIDTRLKQRLQSYEKQLAVNEAETTRILKKQREEYETRFGIKESGYDAEIKTLTSQRDKLQDDLEKEREKAESLRSFLAKYRNSFSVLASRTSEHGHVIDVSTPSSLLVEINPIFRVKRGDQGYVLNRMNRIIAIVELTPADVGARARVIKQIKNEPIRPFDILLLRME